MGDKWLVHGQDGLGHLGQGGWVERVDVGCFAVVVLGKQKGLQILQGLDLFGNGRGPVFGRRDQALQNNGHGQDGHAIVVVINIIVPRARQNVEECVAEGRLGNAVRVIGRRIELNGIVGRDGVKEIRYGKIAAWQADKGRLHVHSSKQ